MSTHELLLDLTLTGAARLVASREVPPVELVDASLSRLKAVDDKLHAYIQVYEQAREVGKAAETMLAAGHRLGPLHGVPVALSWRGLTPPRGTSHALARNGEGRV